MFSALSLHGVQMVTMAKQLIVEIGKQMRFQMRCLFLDRTDPSLNLCPHVGGLPVPSPLLFKAHGTPAKSSQLTSWTPSLPLSKSIPGEEGRAWGFTSAETVRTVLPHRREGLSSILMLWKGVSVKKLKSGVLSH